MDHALVAIGYQTHMLDGIQNERIIEQVMAARKQKIHDDPRHTEYEDSELPQTPETIALVQQVDARMHAIDPRLEREGLWAHILAPGESTMYHMHSRLGFPGIGLSWVYYASHPERSGDLVFFCQVNDRQIRHRVEPEVGKLVIFSATMPHLTTKHAGEGLRTSISGNHFLPQPVQQQIHTGQSRTGVSFFTG